MLRQCYNYNVVNMNNKGFTLIELLAVVAIIGLLGTVATISLTKTHQNINQNSCNEFVKEIEEVACVYANKYDKEMVCDNHICEPLKVEYLINEGLIQSEIDTCTGKEIDKNATVSVAWDDEGEKSCHYNGVRTYAR